jgi:hypothetical protein
MGTPFWICDNCNTYIDDMGSPLTPVQRKDTKTCSFCGRAVGYDYVYCPYCGKKI